ncbi:MAG: winged helix DNA-binding domain-containing protein [Actinomycetota bacterium]
MAERTLTERELNRALLARQMLLQRVSVPLPRALERMGFLQDQYAPSGYIGLWSRVAGFERADLNRALERRTVVQGTLLRATIHLVSRRDYWPVMTAIDEPLRDWWFRATKRGGERQRLQVIDRRARALLAHEPLRRAEIMTSLGLATPDWAGVGLWTPLLRVPPSGTWEQRRADRYGVAEDWIGPSSATPDAGRELLVRRYLAAFGPASRKDIASFTGLPMTLLASVIERLALRTFRDETGGELLDVRGAPLPAADTPAPVRFLPTWDAALLVHARRTQILPERFRPLIFHTKNPQSAPTFLVDGQVAGTWKHEGGKIALQPFEPLPKAVVRELEDEAVGLATLHA